MADYGDYRLSTYEQNICNLLNGKPKYEVVWNEDSKKWEIQKKHDNNEPIILNALDTKEQAEYELENKWKPLEQKITVDSTNDFISYVDLTLTSFLGVALKGLWVISRKGIQIIGIEKSMTKFYYVESVI